MINRKKGFSMLYATRRIYSYETDANSGSRMMRDANLIQMGSGPNSENTMMEITTSVNRKEVPQRGCSMEYLLTFSGVSSAFASKALMVLCSAPWYWKTRLISGMNPMPQIYPTNRTRRNNPSRAFPQKEFQCKYVSAKVSNTCRQQEEESHTDGQ